MKLKVWEGLVTCEHDNCNRGAGFPDWILFSLKVVGDLCETIISCDWSKRTMLT